jgi:hypothetical protein
MTETKGEVTFLWSTDSPFVALGIDYFKMFLHKASMLKNDSFVYIVFVYSLRGTFARL